MQEDAMLYKVMLPNPYLQVGTYVEDGDDGAVQEVRVRTEEGRLIPGGYVGLTFPKEAVRKYLLAIKATGFDHGGAWREARRIEIH